VLKKKAEVSLPIYGLKCGTGYILKKEAPVSVGDGELSTFS